VALGELFPENLILGIEIRSKVVEYVHQRIQRLREENKETGRYQNISVLNTNAMKYFPNFFLQRPTQENFLFISRPPFQKIQSQKTDYKSSIACRICVCVSRRWKIVHCYRCQRFV